MQPWFGSAITTAFADSALLTATACRAKQVVAKVGRLDDSLAENESSLGVRGILLPTLIHVSLFTLVFMMLGAYRSGSKAQALLVIVYLTAIGIILAVRRRRRRKFRLRRRRRFGNGGPALGRLRGIAQLQT